MARNGRRRFDEPLSRGTLVRRYKRFLADVAFDDGDTRIVHCANSGSMMGMNAPGLPVVVSDSGNPSRKLRHTLELVQVDDGGGRTWVGVHTGRPNAMVLDALRSGWLPGIAHDAPVRGEVRYGTNSRIDLLAEPDGAAPVYIEVKNTTLAGRADDGVLEARFPDAVTARGQKHVRELMARVDKGDRAMFVFLVNRSDCARFRPAADIDPEYAHLLGEATAAGVETVALQVRHHLRRAPSPGAVNAAWGVTRILPS